MRFAAAALVAAFAGTVLAFPAAVPVYSPEERDTGNIDAQACYIVAYHLDNCQGNAGALLGVPASGNVCVGVAKNSGNHRHSYAISAACPILNVYYYTENSCAGTTPVENLNQSPGCYDIVADTYIHSIRAQYAH